MYVRWSFSSSCIRPDHHTCIGLTKLENMAFYASAHPNPARYKRKIDKCKSLFVKSFHVSDLRLE